MRQGWLGLAVIALWSLIAGCRGGGAGGEMMERMCQGTVPATPSYAMHIQPVFSANCTFSGCHGPNPPSGLQLTSYANLMAGGRSGPAVIPGDAENSLLVKRIEGRIPPRMPLNRDPLCDFQIQTIRRWIDQGAKNN